MPRASSFDIAVTVVDGRTRVSPQGEIDSATSEAFSAVLAEQAATDGVVEVDLSGVTFIDSTGLRVLVVGQETAAAHGGRFVIVGVPPLVRRMFEVTGLVEVFELE